MAMLEFADIPKPYKRFYDDKRRKRWLFVRITSWRGISIGAKHYYAEVCEQDNYIVYKNRHYGFGEDTKLKGRKYGGIMDTSFNTFNAALEWVILIIKEHFPNHKIVECNGGLITLRQLKQKL